MSKLDEIFQNNQIILSEGGLETDLIFKDKINLPFFSCIDLFKSADTKQTIYDHYLKFVKVAQKHNFPVILNTPTWRFHIDWTSRLGYNEALVAERTKEAVALVRRLKGVYRGVIVCGVLGPRCDGYVVSDKMTVEEAKEYHAVQVRSLAASDADYMTAFTLNYVEEAIGITLAAKEIAATPIVISFTLNSEGVLPSGDTLEEAITKVDAASGHYPHHYSINCVHPIYFIELFKTNKDKDWIKRVKGIKPNASRKSHEELDNLGSLDVGDMKELADLCKEVQESCKHIQVFGGCCGTTADHIECMYQKVKVN